MKSIRLFILVAIMLCLPICLIPGHEAKAQIPASEAGQKIMRAVEQVLQILQSEQYVAKESKADLQKALDPIINEVFDFTELSKRTIGPRWENFTPEQRSEFSQAFARLLSDTYIGRLQVYSGEQVFFTGERAGSKGNMEIQTIVSKNNQKTPIFYYMHQNPDWKIYDVLVEGVSLVKNYRAQFQEILVNKSPVELIDMVKSKSAQNQN